MAARTIRAADLFCGAGGTSTGMLMACRDLGFKLDLVAVNHWPLAIQTHMRNYPWARHICASLMPIEPRQPSELFEGGVDAIDPRKAVPGGKLDLLMASPECTHHSNARGGKPRSDQSRATPWCILRWADAVHPEAILIENVPEFRSWGPLGRGGKPIKAEAGRTFAAFLQALESLGYTVDHRVICAADYGDATTRKRLFIQARRGRTRIVWPEPTHSKAGKNGLPCWRAAREIIDWTIPNPSIFARPKALSPNTIDKIAYGLRKFGGERAEPFLVMLYGTGKARSVDEPLPTVTAQGGHIALCEPFIVNYHGGKDGARRVHRIDDPLATLDTSNRYGICEPFIIATGHAKQISRVRSVDEPLSTLVTKAEHYLIEPVVVKYYGTGRAQSIDQPLDTLTTKPRFGLAEFPYVKDGDGNAIGLDIRFRMLQPHESAAAMSFPPEYQFCGTKDEVTKQIGNAVPTHTACQLTKALVA
jgi:DNA (cytosine-5)-methyltransferase 1